MRAALGSPRTITACVHSPRVHTLAGQHTHAPRPCHVPVQLVATDSAGALQPSALNRVLSAGLDVLHCADPHEKTSRTRQFMEEWRNPERASSAMQNAGGALQQLPAEPARPPHPVQYEWHVPKKPADVPVVNHTLHALAHIELNAVDMYWDTLCEAALADTASNPYGPLPRAFYDDFLGVVADECRHFEALSDRLDALGSPYGALPAHKSMWQLITLTRSKLAARIALVPLVQEARGLDAGPKLVQRLRSMQDKESAALVQMIVDEEVGHVKTGVKWFKHMCQASGDDPKSAFQELVTQYHPIGVVPPFNEVARQLADFDPEWYKPIAVHMGSDGRYTAPSKRTTTTTAAASGKPHTDHRKEFSTHTRTTRGHLWCSVSLLPRSCGGTRTATARAVPSGVLCSRSVADRARSVASAADTGSGKDSCKRLLYIVSVWPEPRSSAAGLRSMSLIKVAQSAGYEVTVASAAKPNARQQELTEVTGVRTCSIQPNSSEFDRFLESFGQQDGHGSNVTVIFDRFVMEEIYSFRVRRVLPQALRVLDTQDLHFLRQHRQRHAELRSPAADFELLHPGHDPLASALSAGQLDFDATRGSDTLLRELAAVHRSDLTLLVSSFEQNLLLQRFGVSAHKTALAPFFYKHVKSSSGEGDSCAHSEHVDCGSVGPSAPTYSAWFSRDGHARGAGSSTDVESMDADGVDGRPSPTSSIGHGDTANPAETSTRQQWLRQFAQRAHFVSIGNFRHAPNRDSVRLLRHVIWPKLRSALVPLGMGHAEMHVYGAYPSKDDTELHSPDINFLMKGTARDQYLTLAKYKALLAPLRFGAGIKGKVSDSWSVSTPVITTPIGAESMGDHIMPWGGFIAGSVDDFVRRSVQCYAQPNVWISRAQQSHRLCFTLFDHDKQSWHLREALEQAVKHRDVRRAEDWMGGLLWESLHRSTEHRSTVRELKQTLRGLR